jgi:hypothetical protein
MATIQVDDDHPTDLSLLEDIDSAYFSSKSAFFLPSLWSDEGGTGLLQEHASMAWVMDVECVFWNVLNLLVCHFRIIA